MRTQRASSSIDYVLIVSIALAALLLVGAYVQRGIMYKYKQSGDSIGAGRLSDGTFNLTPKVNVYLNR